MKKNPNEITANKCVIGETYYATGEYWDYEKDETLLNTPVVFMGKDSKPSYSGPSYSREGQYVFKINEITEIRAISKTAFFIKPLVKDEKETNNRK